jgi:serine/threonine protein kinase
LIGKSLCHYRIQRLLGAGGMGEVYVAEDMRLKRNVALKVLPGPAGDDPARRQRFQREAEAVAALDHPNIVTIYSIESGAPDGEGPEVHFFTMQLVDGEPLSRQIPAGGLPVPRLLSLATQLADAVGAAHEKGILHRDLKPGNIVVGADDRLRVLDFGLAKLRPGGDASDEDSAAATPTGAILGTRTAPPPPAPAPSWGRLLTCPRSRSEARLRTHAPMCSPWESCCTRWLRDSGRSRAPPPAT